MNSFSFCLPRILFISPLILNDNLALCVCLVTQLCPTLCDSTDSSPPGSSVHGDSPGKNLGVGCHALLQGIFPTQEPNSGLPHCRQIPSHQGNPRILDCVAYPFSRGTLEPRIQLGSPALQTKDSLPAELTAIHDNLARQSIFSWKFIYSYVFFSAL